VRGVRLVGLLTREETYISVPEIRRGLEVPRAVLMSGEKVAPTEGWLTAEAEAETEAASADADD
jgi:uncharacterized protein YbbK (DUF523 family)